MNAIDVSALSKTYDNAVFALKDLNLSIPQGEIFGFLGPNGSGKTTTVRLLNGILTPSGGNAYILGRDIKSSSKDIRRLCGVMTETAACYESMTGFENLKFFGKMYGMEDKDIAARSEGLLHSLDLYGAKDKKVKAYSTGMKKRISLARALLHNPKILFLDEPTSGLDPEASMNVTKLIKNLSLSHGVTVFLCTHQLKYAEEICSMYGFIHKGSVIGLGSFEELLRRQNSKIYLEIRGRGISHIKGAVDLGEGRIRLEIENDDDASNILHGITSSGGRIFEAKQIRWSLEDLYFSYQKAASSVIS